MHDKKANLTITDGRIANMEYNVTRNGLQDVNYHIADYDKKNYASILKSLEKLKNKQYSYVKLSKIQYNIGKSSKIKLIK